MSNPVNDGLSVGEIELFRDVAIMNAYEAWNATEKAAGRSGTRKAFLMRIRFLVQSGAISR